MPESPYIAILGAASIDLTGFARQPLRYEDSNPGSLKVSIGGVGRNIAENLARLGLSTRLICAIGDDIYGDLIQSSCQEIGIDIQDSLFLKNRESPIYLSILDDKNDLALELSAMDICEEMDVAFIRQKEPLIRQASLAVLDTNVPEEVLSDVVRRVPSQRYFLDTVDGGKALRARNILSSLFLIKTNVLEAEILSGIKIANADNLKDAASFFHEAGVDKVFITRGEQGVFYSGEGVAEAVDSEKVAPVNTNGAGDAFTAGLIYAYCQGMAFRQWARVGMACAKITIAHENTVNPEISEKQILSLNNGK